MSLKDVVGSIGAALQTPEPPAQSPEARGDAGSFVVGGQPATPSPLPRPVQLSLSLGGMLRFDSDIQDSESFTAGGTELLGAIAPLFRGDLSLVGFDQVISEQPRRGDDLRVPASALQLIKRAGPSGLLLPVERVLTDGSEAAQATLERINQRYLQPLGLGDEGLHRLRVNGLSLIHLHMSARPAGEGGALYRGYDLERALKELPALREESHVLIVSIASAGREKEPSAAQRSAARRLVQAGADLVIGIGGEQLQELERYQLTDLKGQPREALILYSLGTLLCEDRRKPEVLSGAVLQLALTVQPGTRQLHYQALSYTPTWQRRWTEGGKVRFSVLNCMAPPPAGMSQAQQKAMAEAIPRVQRALKLGIEPQR